MDELTIRDALLREITTAPAGGVFHDAQTEAIQRNAFCLRLTPDGPIYTVTITHGGSLGVETHRGEKRYGNWLGGQTRNF